MRHLLLGLALGHRGFVGCTNAAVTEAVTGAGGSHERRRLLWRADADFGKLGLMSTNSGYTWQRRGQSALRTSIGGRHRATEPKGEG